MTRWLPLLVLCSVAALAVEAGTAAVTVSENADSLVTTQLLPADEPGLLPPAPLPEHAWSPALLGRGRAVVQDVFHPPVRG